MSHCWGGPAKSSALFSTHASNLGHYRTCGKWENSRPHDHPTWKTKKSTDYTFASNLETFLETQKYSLCQQASTMVVQGPDFGFGVSNPMSATYLLCAWGRPYTLPVPQSSANKYNSSTCLRGCFKDSISYMYRSTWNNAWHTVNVI